MEILKRRRGEGRRGEATYGAISAEEIADLHSTRRVMGFSRWTVLASGGPDGKMDPVW